MWAVRGWVFFFSFRKIAEAGNFQKLISLNLFSSSPTIVFVLLLYLFSQNFKHTPTPSTRKNFEGANANAAARYSNLMQAAASLYTQSWLTLHTGTMDFFQNLAIWETPYWSVINWLTEQWHINADDGAKKFRCWLMVGENKDYIWSDPPETQAVRLHHFFLPAV